MKPITLSHYFDTGECVDGFTITAGGQTGYVQGDIFLGAVRTNKRGASRRTRLSNYYLSYKTCLVDLNVPVVDNHAGVIEISTA